MTIVNGCSSFWFVRHRFGGRVHGLKLLHLVAPCWLILIKNGDSKTIRKEKPEVKDVRGSNGYVLQANHVVTFWGACDPLFDAVMSLIMSIHQMFLLIFYF